MYLRNITVKSLHILGIWMTLERFIDIQRSPCKCPPPTLGPQPSYCPGSSVSEDSVLFKAYYLVGIKTLSFQNFGFGMVFECQDSGGRKNGTVAALSGT